MDQYPIALLPQFKRGHLADLDFTIGHRHTRFQRAAPGRAEYQMQPLLTGKQVRRRIQQVEMQLPRARLRGRQDLDVLTTDQGADIRYT
ncbi:hypothetical protein FQZ97_1021290 [compost metagenome]